MDYETALHVLVAALRRDADFHERGEVSRIGGGFDSFDALMSRGHRDSSIALAFWDAWIDERNHRFPGFYNGISGADWPRLAREIADNLERKENISEAIILLNFERLPRKTLWQKLRDWFVQ